MILAYCTQCTFTTLYVFCQLLLHMNCRKSKFRKKDKNAWKRTKSIEDNWKDFISRQNHSQNGCEKSMPNFVRENRVTSNNEEHKNGFQMIKTETCDLNLSREKPLRYFSLVALMSRKKGPRLNSIFDRKAKLCSTWF